MSQTPVGQVGRQLSCQRLHFTIRGYTRTIRANAVNTEMREGSNAAFIKTATVDTDGIRYQRQEGSIERREGVESTIEKRSALRLGVCN